MRIYTVHFTIVSFLGMVGLMYLNISLYFTIMCEADLLWTGLILLKVGLSLLHMSEKKEEERTESGMALFGDWLTIFVFMSVLSLFWLFALYILVEVLAVLGGVIVVLWIKEPFIRYQEYRQRSRQSA